jgi:hypothetical protein
MGRRKIKFEQLKQQKEKRQKRIIIGASVAVFVIALVVIIIIVSRQAQTQSYQSYGGVATTSSIRLTPDSDGDLRVPLDRLQSRLTYVSYGGSEELIFWRDNSGVIRTAFDTCVECYPRGSVHFTLSGNILTCSQCGTTQPLSVLITDGWGGCRPVLITPAMRNDTDTEVVLSSAVLSYAGDMFSQWRASDFSLSFAVYGTDEAHILE